MADTFKVILIGDGGVGKTTLVKKMMSGDFEKKYTATLGVEVNPLRFHTNHGEMTINIWDCAGQERFGGLRDGYYLAAQGAIVAFDLTSRVTMANTGKWIRDAWRMNTDIPFVACGLKSDVADRELTTREAQHHFEKMDISLSEVSIKTGHNCDEPFLELLRKMSGHDDLVFMAREEEVTAPSLMRALL